MSSDLFDFDVAVHADGYEWMEAVLEEHPDSKPEAYLRPCKLFGEERHYNPLIESTGLFHDFAKLDMSKEAILAFANEHGALRKWQQIVPTGWDRRDWRLRTLGESMRDWCESIGHMKLAVRLWRMVRSGDSEGLSRHIRWTSEKQLVFDSLPDLPVSEEDPWVLWREASKEELELDCEPGDLVQPAKRVIATCVESNLGQNALVTVRSLEEHEIQIYVEMMGLNDALWFQFAQAVMGNKDYRQCRTCGRWYELHPDIARTNRHYCSDACRSRAYRQRKIEARRLFAEGIAVDDIADELKTTPSAVQAWISSSRRKVGGR